MVIEGLDKDIVTVRLERLKWVILQSLSEEFIQADDVAWEQFGCFMANAITLRIKGHIFGQKLEQREVSYPSTWWDAVKERFFPAWLLVRFPVTYKILRLEGWATYPKLSLPGQETFYIERLFEDGSEV